MEKEKMNNMTKKFERKLRSFLFFCFLTDQKPYSPYIKFAKLIKTTQRLLPNKTIILSMDKHGILLINNKNKIYKYFPVNENQAWNKIPITNVSGSGDTFTGALVSKLANNENLEVAIKYGLEAAQYSLRHEGSISDLISSDLYVSFWKSYEIEL